MCVCSDLVVFDVMILRHKPALLPSRQELALLMQKATGVGAVVVVMNGGGGVLHRSAVGGVGRQTHTTRNF